MKLLLFTLFLTISSVFSLAQNPDMMVMSNGDSVTCSVLEFDYNWVTIEIEQEGRKRTRNIPTEKVRTLVKAYETEQEKIVFGEGLESVVVAKPPKALPVAEPENINLGLPRDMTSTYLIRSANDLEKAGLHGLVSIGTIFVGSAAAVGLLYANEPLAATAVYGVAGIISLGFTISAYNNLRKSGKHLRRHAKLQVTN